MYHGDHLPPHFHARYGGQKAVVSIEAPRALHGSPPPRIIGLVVEWATIHRVELMDNWRRARESARLEPIAPLE
jgi:hypothetical protein